jgi:hypothetical protein
MLGRFEVLEQCWAYEEEERPGFARLYEMLMQMDPDESYL